METSRYEPDEEEILINHTQGMPRRAAELAARGRPNDDAEIDEPSEARQTPPKHPMPFEFLEALVKFETTIIPTFPPNSPSFARVNAARERCDGLIHAARPAYDKLLARAARHDLDLDWRGAHKLREKARADFHTAKANAAVELLNAQAKEYLPLTGRHFPHQTLPILAKTSINIYGRDDAGNAIETVCHAVAVRLHEWSAQWWEKEADIGTAEHPPQRKAKQPGRPPEGCKVNGERFKEYRKAAGLTQEQLAEELGIGLSAISKAERGVGTLAPDIIDEAARIFRNRTGSCTVQFLLENSPK